MFTSYESTLYSVMLLPVVVLCLLLLEVGATQLRAYLVRHVGRAFWKRLKCLHENALSQRLRECMGRRLCKNQGVSRAVVRTQSNQQFQALLIIIHDTLNAETETERMRGEKFLCTALRI